MTLESTTRAETIGAVTAVISALSGLSREQIGETAELIGDLGMDSVDLIELTNCLEREFEVELPDSATTGVRSVADVVDMIVAAERSRGK